MQPDRLYVFYLHIATIRWIKHACRADKVKIFLSQLATEPFLTAYIVDFDEASRYLGT
jgi:hypothetical protein